MPKPDIHLGVGGGSHAVQTAEILKKFEEVLIAERPDVLIVVGDVNSTVACALAAVKLPTDAGQRRPTVVHVESGLRSFDRSMPEEHNRIMTDHLADVLFVTEPSGLKNLKKEGVAARNVHFVGNTMIDTLLAFEAKAERSSILQTLGLRDDNSELTSGNEVTPYALLTLHRPANVDNRDAFASIMEGIAELAGKMPVIFPAHPRTKKRIEEFGMSGLFHSLEPGQLRHSKERGKPEPGIQLIEPCGYLDFVCLMKNARMVVTDSGGIQEETTCLGVPCVTVRENTERPVTIASGTNI
jgi:UDP-N-acetylglucosamine 2-epimerase (non-hydrolysing)